MTTDTIADTLTRIRNAQIAGHKVVSIPVSKMTKSVLTVLKDEGFIDAFEVSSKAKIYKGTKRTPFQQFSVFLKYYESGLPVISSVSRVSKPGRRDYAGVTKLPRVSNGLGVSIISTSQGVISDREARRRKIGGEVLAVVG